MIILPTNSANFTARLFFLGVIFFLGYLFINFGLKSPSNDIIIFKITAIHFEFKVVYIMYFLIIIIAFLALTIISSLLSVKKIEIDTSSGSITFIGLISKKILAISDISEYHETIHRNRFKIYYGLLLKLKSNQTIQIAGQNVKSLSDFKDYLNDKKINCIGQKKMKFPFN